MNQKTIKRLEQKLLDAAQNLLDYSNASKEELFELINIGCTEIGETSPKEVIK